MNQQEAWRIGVPQWVQFSTTPFRGAYVVLLQMADGPILRNTRGYWELVTRHGDEIAAKGEQP